MSTDQSQTPVAEPADRYRAALYAADTLHAPNHIFRLLATVFDLIFSLLPIAVIFVATVMALGAVGGPNAEDNNLVSLFIGAFQLGVIGLHLLYGAVFESSPWPATPGKRLMGLKVVGSDGSRLGFGAALGRNVAKWVSLSFCWLLGIIVLLDDGARGVWDRAASTRVVENRR